MTTPDPALVAAALKARADALTALRGLFTGVLSTDLAYVDVIAEAIDEGLTFEQAVGPVMGGWVALAVQLAVELAQARKTTPLDLLDSIEQT
jgi:hypothetical protein